MTSYLRTETEPAQRAALAGRILGGTESSLLGLTTSSPESEKSQSVSRSVVSDSFATPWTVARQAPPSMEFSRQDYCSGLPFPSPEDLPNPRIEPESPALRADALPSEPPDKLTLRVAYPLGKMIFALLPAAVS